MASDLDGLTIVDTAVTPPLRGRIVGVVDASTVLVSWRRGQVERLHPVAGRYVVEAP